MLVIGLTGSMGMGKSTTARLFFEAGVPVYDADSVVHRLYAGEAAPLIEAAFPGVTNVAGVDRQKLAAQVVDDSKMLKRLEDIVHPLVRREEQEFLSEAMNAGAAVAVLDIPLLFETGGDQRVDVVVVVTATPELQRARVFERAGMNETKFQTLLAKQVPDAEKRRRADFIVDTSHGIECARSQVVDILSKVTKSSIQERPSKSSCGRSSSIPKRQA
jgi:dephospho-CoA kinase